MAEAIDTTRRGFFKTGIAGLAFGGIVGQTIFEASQQEPEPEPAPSKFVGDGWYSHKEPVGTLTVWFVTRFEAFDGPDGNYYRAYRWPGPSFNPDYIYLTDREVEEFIFAAET